MIDPANPTPEEVQKIKQWEATRPPGRTTCPCGTTISPRTSNKHRTACPWWKAMITILKRELTQ